ncbi:MAG: toll/interleukin-1 receptor domain-containing protein [Paludisphaera borealis]|uniref:toll/interleukin-1 receptor domain-containing protein n=1 Tax=Paludisphaera borealis TaxID=1387353 RepID=UPI00283EEC4F|nr:toll/interleukin-1 receptor domain-containing protein [Paludisphaera borealis]MDR3623425.1 toll/interleukin-1 receptor domain-containing protein [Paludisphaera borealis]
MDRDEALRLLTGGEEGVRKWNEHRRGGGEIPRLVDTPLREADLIRAYLLSGADLSGADLVGADLSEADLVGADLSGADLSGADLSEADLVGADLIGAYLSGADLSGADLSGANLRGANLSRAFFQGAVCSSTNFANLDLSEAQGLDEIVHKGPSSVGVDTLFASKGRIPEAFLRGCGVPEALIVQLPSLIGSMNPSQFYSCFISYSSADKEFARRLHSRMVEENLRVWFDKVDMQSGKKIHEQIEVAIGLHDRLLLVVSPNSMNSEWVKTELRKAFKIEKREGKRKLFPVGLAPYSAMQDWECFDADHGKDLAREVREYFIPDFSNWKDHDAFEAQFGRLLRDLKSEAT